MKTIIILALNSFLFICLIRQVISRRVISDHSLCNDNQILSIFNLKDDLIFQVSTNTSGRSEFWKLNNTNADDRDRPGSFSFPKTNYKHSYRLEKFESFLKDKSFDVSKQVIGHIVDVEQTVYDCMNQPGNYVLDVRTQCGQLIYVYHNSSLDFVCIYGTLSQVEGQSLQAFRYDSSDGTLSDIDVQNIKDNIENECFERRQFVNFWTSTERENYTAIMVWLETDDQTGEQFWRNFSVSDYPRSVEHKRAFWAFDGQTNDTNKGHSPYKYAFRYNRHFPTLGCEEDCGLTTRLYNISMVVDRKASKLVVYNKAIDITMHSFLRCEEYQQFDPQIFCEQNQEFDSIFSLGNDKYFQKSGHFWRYSSIGFTNSANKLLTQNMTNIRFDSDIVSLLENNGFDTLCPISGFTFKSREQDFCPEGIYDREDCRQKYFKSTNHYRACIFGYKSRFTGNGEYQTEIKVLSYQYSPSGLRPFSEERHNTNTLTFCTKVLNKLQVMTEDFKNGTKELLGVTASHTSDTQTFVLFLTRGRGDNKHYYSQINVSDYGVDLIFDKHKWNIPEPIDSIYSPFSSLFYHNSQMYGYGSNRNGHLYLLDQMISGEPNNWARPSNETLFSLFRCPFNQTYSVVSIDNDTICGEPTEWNRTQSIFMIGTRVYHQKGRHFYGFVSHQRSFLYDKYITDLFATYFDTRYRITGYTWRPKSLNKPYEVVIHGKSHPNYRHLGQYIFAAFSLNETILPLLRPISSEDLSIEHTITLGSESPVVKDKFFNVLGSWISGSRNDYIFWIREYGGNGMYEYLMAKQDSEVGFPFYSNFDDSKWENRSVSMSRLNYTDIIGTYELREWTADLHLVAWSRGPPRKLVIYTISEFKNGPAPSGGIIGLLLDLNMAREYRDYHAFLCGEPDPGAAESSSGVGNKTMTFLLLFIILALIVIALIVGFLAYSRSNLSENKDQNKSRIDTNYDKSVQTAKPTEKKLSQRKVVLQSNENIAKNANEKVETESEEKPITKSEPNLSSEDSTIESVRSSL